MQLVASSAVVTPRDYVSCWRVVETLNKLTDGFADGDYMEALTLVTAMQQVMNERRYKGN